MADSRQRLFFDIFAKDRGAKREFDQLGRSVDKAGDSMDDMGKDARSLDKQIDTTKKLIHQLGDEFDRTGNHDLLGDLKKRRAELSMLQQIRKELDAFGKGGDNGRRSIFSQMFDNLGDTLKGLPSQLKGAAIVGAIGIGTVMAPMIGAAIAGAVVGAVGLGGIAGGIAAAASDSRVKSEAAKLGHALLPDLKSLGTPFVAPLLDQFGELEEVGVSFTADLHKGLAGLAPLIKPLVEGVRGFARNLGPGLATAFKTAQPVLRAFAHELPRLGSALSGMFDSIAGNSRETTLGMLALMRATEGLIRATGFLVGELEYEFSWLVNLGDKLDELDTKMDRLGVLKPNFGFGFTYLTDQASDMTDALNDARNANEDFNTTVAGLEGSMYDVANATDDAHDAMVDYAKGIQDQLDPMLNFIHRQQDVKQAQKDWTEAVKEHGKKSPEAREATLRLAEAILAANTAAATASGTFGGKLDPALEATLTAGGATAEQLKILKGATSDARHELEKYEGVYKAKAILEFFSYRSGERDPSGSAAKNRNKPNSSGSGSGGSHRASGGPVMAGQSYIIGENGPERVTFGANGMVTPTGRSSGMASAPTRPPIIINFPVVAGDSIAQGVLTKFREGVSVQGGNADAVTVYFGGVPA